MIRIYVKRQNEQSGHVFKSRFSTLDDRISMLPFTYVIKGIISSDDYLDNPEKIASKFNIKIVETKIDGRCKRARNMRYFSWDQVLEQPSISKRMRLL